jgi:hypothetical protein
MGSLMGARVTAARGPRLEASRLILEVLVDELYVSAPNAPDHEALLGPVVNRLIVALEGGDPPPS